MNRKNYTFFEVVVLLIFAVALFPVGLVPVGLYIMFKTILSNKNSARSDNKDED